MRHSSKHDGLSSTAGYVMAGGLAFVAAYLLQGTADGSELAIVSAAISVTSLIAFSGRVRVRVPARAQRRARRRSE